MWDIPIDVIQDALNKAIDALIEKHRELGMEATGDWIRSLEGVAGHNSGVIMGAKYTEQLVHGREPGRRPPIEPLERWVAAKFGLSGKEARGAAFAIATKIAKEGTTWHKQGGSDLMEILEDPQVVSAFFTEVGAYLNIMVSNNLLRELQAVSD